MIFGRIFGCIFAMTLIFSVIVAVIQMVRGEDWFHALCFLCTISIVVYIELDNYFIGFAETMRPDNQIILLVQRTLYFIGCFEYGFHTLLKMHRRSNAASIKE